MPFVQTIEENGRYVCPVCGLGRDLRRPFLVPFIHACAQAAQDIGERRESLKRQLGDFHARCTENTVMVRPLDETLEIVDQLCAGCPDWTGDDCRQYTGCAQRAKWERAYGLQSGYLPRLVGLAKPCDRMTNGPQ